jgi:hypothetical protein
LQRDERLPPWFFSDHPGYMALARNILSKQDISLAKLPLLTAAHFNFSPSFKGNDILRANNIVPVIVKGWGDFPEEEGLYTGWFSEKAKGTTGFQLNLNVIKMGLVILPGIEVCDSHILSSGTFPCRKKFRIAKPYLLTISTRDIIFFSFPRGYFIITLMTGNFFCMSECLEQEYGSGPGYILTFFHNTGTKYRLGERIKRDYFL